MGKFWANLKQIVGVFSAMWKTFSFDLLRTFDLFDELINQINNWL